MAGSALMRALVGFVAALCCIGPSAIAYAQQPTKEAEAEPTESADTETEAESGDDEAYALFKLGKQRYAEGRYEEAIDAFEKSHALSGRPQLLLNLANVHERLGQLARAIAHLERYQPDAPPSVQATLLSRIEQVKARLAMRKTPSPSPAPLPLPEPPDAVCPTRVCPPPEETSILRPMSYAVGGLAFAGLLASGVLGALALSARADVDDQCTGELCPPQAADDIDREMILSAAADATFGASIAVLLVGITMFAVSFETETGQVAFAPSGTGGALKWDW